MRTFIYALPDGLGAALNLFLVPVPSGYRRVMVRLEALSFDITTDANIANRVPHIQVVKGEDITNAVVIARSRTVQASGGTNHHLYSIRGGQELFATGVNIATGGTLPPAWLANSDLRYRIYIEGAQAGDLIKNIRALFSVAKANH